MSEREILGLEELQKRIKGGLEASLPRRFWVRAEIGELKVNPSGHCYLNLIEKGVGSQVSAKISAIIWASTFSLLKLFFEESTGTSLQQGVTILAEVGINYSPLYGLSLIIYNIDPSFTMGEQELQRQRTIAKLEKEGMIGLNSQLQIVHLPRKIAIISSETAAGYRDFVKELEPHMVKFNITTTLYPAVMQGASSVSSIIAALDEIAQEGEPYQLVLIIRGGGAAQDLVSFDSYNLALNIAQYPLPVITGIGHDHDYHVADMVAHSHLKTPTAVALFIADLFIAEEQQLYSLSNRLAVALRGRVEREEGRLTAFKEQVASLLKRRVERENHRMELLEAKLKSANPLTLLDRGYAMVYKEGVREIDSEKIEIDEEITLLLSKEKLTCKVTNKEKLK